MANLTKNTLLPPKLSVGDAKKAATDKIAQSLIAHEVALRNAKTARLRLARLAKESADREAALNAAKPTKASKRA